jgi:hypothetical protein
MKELKANNTRQRGSAWHNCKCRRDFLWKMVNCDRPLQKRKPAATNIKINFIIGRLVMLTNVTSLIEISLIAAAECTHKITLDPISSF